MLQLHDAKNKSPLSQKTTRSTRQAAAYQRLNSRQRLAQIFGLCASRLSEIGTASAFAADQRGNRAGYFSGFHAIQQIR
jgi:hypothetical protein